VYTKEPASGGNLMIALWLLLLFAVQILAIAIDHSKPVNSIPELFASSVMHYLAIALLCFAVIGVLGKALQGEFPSAAGPLLAMTLVYGVLLTSAFLMPAPQSLDAVSASQTEQGKPINFDSSNGRKDWYGFARTYEDKRDWQGLLAVSNQWAASEPDNADVWFNQGLAYSGLGQHEQALEAEQKSARIDPNRASIWINIGNSYLSLNRYAESEVASRKALDLDSNLAIAWNNLGAALAGEGKHDEAMADYQHAIAIDPNYATAWENVGNQYYRRKQYPEALDAYQRTLTLDPSNQKASVGIANVQEMQRLGNH